MAAFRLGEELHHQLVEHQRMLRNQRRSLVGAAAWIVLHEAASPGAPAMHPQLERRRLLKAPWAQPQPALFLDRDGVLIEDRHHLCDPDQVELCPGALSLVNHANQQDWRVVVITNQSGIARGYFDWDAYERVTDRLLALLGPNAPIAAIYANGHGPDAPCTSWRKPSPAMLIAASKELNLDLNRSLLIGDRLSDLKAGARAGLPWLVHVLSGHGVEERASVETWCIGTSSDNHRSELTLLNSLLEFPCHRLQSNG
jgi:D-glycero-D-manno-heptose 1,7-bisphosphate phosphatase